MFSALKKMLGKKKKTKPQSSSLDDHLGQDHLQANSGFGDADVKKIKSLSTGTANESIDRVKYNKEIGDSGTKEGFFKTDGWFATPMYRVSSKDRNAEGQDAHLGIRAVMSSRIDKMLGTDALTEEHFAEHDGRQGTVSSLAKGSAMRDLKGQHMAEASVDGNDANYQQSMWNLQLNDYLSGQADRHAGNIFYDDDTGRVRGIDNDLAFGDQFNETIGTERPKRGDNSKHVRELPHLIDAKTAESVLAIDENTYLDMLLGQEGDRERLDFDEAMQAYERMLDLKRHIYDIQSGEGEGEIVEEWNEDTYATAMEHGEKRSSYLRITQEDGAEAEEYGDNTKLTQTFGTKTFKGDQKRTKKRNKQAKKDAKAQKKASRRAQKADRAANKLNVSASSAVAGNNLFDYLDPSI